MTRGFQQLIIVGNLGRDPEMRYTADGVAVSKFSVAVNTGSNDTQVEWFEVEAWEKTAESVNNYTSKGDTVQVVGQIRTQKWLDKETGEQRSKMIVRAREVLFLNNKRQQIEDAEGVPEVAPTPARAPARQPQQRPTPATRDLHRRSVAEDRDDIPF